MQLFLMVVGLHNMAVVEEEEEWICFIAFSVEGEVGEYWVWLLHYQYSKVLQIFTWMSCS